MGPVAPVRRASPRPDPAPPAVVALRLLGERLEEAAHELVRGETLERGELLRRELREVLRVAEPREEPVRHPVPELPLDALEHAREDSIVRVEVGLALHETRPPEMVEAEQARAMEALLERREEPLPLLDRDGDAGFAEPVEEV